MAWFFFTKHFQPSPSLMWNSILVAWKQVHDRLQQKTPKHIKQVMRQPLFGNPTIYTAQDLHLGKFNTQGMLHFINVGIHMVADF